jgi:hypothetical protein
VKRFFLRLPLSFVYTVVELSCVVLSFRMEPQGKRNGMGYT